VAREADLPGPPPRPRDEPRPAGEVARRGGFLGFVQESWAELHKVEWPNQNQLVQGTVVVIVACTIVGIFLWANDMIWKRVVENLLLGQ
jgi:preprotein translocase SecE subunit